MSSTCSEIHINDIGTAFRVTVKDESDTVVDISTASSLRIFFAKPDGTTETKTASHYTDGTDGIMEYITQSGDLDIVGSWSLQGVVSIGGGTWHTDIYQFKVYGNL